MRVLIYKRTHNGDPDENGCFGVHDCMGAKRDLEYDAVVGVGGIGQEPQANGIAGTVNWIGIGPHKSYVGKRGPEVTFDHFLFRGGDGPDFRTLAPELASRMYASGARIVLRGLTHQEQREAEKIVHLAADSPPSPGGAVSDLGASSVRSCVCKRRANHSIRK